MNIIGNTDTGKIRSKNEDGYAFGYFDDGSAWAVVCDGMGGVHGGKVASSVAIDMVSEKIKKCYNKLMPVSSLENLLLSAITTANVTVFDRSSAQYDLKGMGTTIVAAVIKNNEACIAHVGDSRAYIINGDSIRQITKDHSLVQEMLDKGQITELEYETAPMKNIITRAMGVKEEIDIDFDFVTINENDALILCSDGLSGLVNKEDILKIYKQEPFENLANRYIEAANEKGGKDNITVVVMKG